MSKETKLFESKVSATRRAMWLERVWVRFWIPLALIGAFLAASFAGVWPQIGLIAHVALLAAFALALAGAIAYALLAAYPFREDAVRRIERASGVPHRPASSYEDTVSMLPASVAGGDTSTGLLWQAHRERLAAQLRKLEPSPPRPATHRYDPYALRTLAVMGLVLSAGLLGDASRDRVLAAFHFGPPPLASNARLDAWATPPPYTGRAPLLIADGQRPGVLLSPAEGKAFEVPERTQLVVRATGTGGGTLAVDFKADGASATERIVSEPLKGLEGVAELKMELRQSGTITVPGQSKPWQFTVIKDTPPKIALVKPPEPTQRGGMKLTYKLEDDYGVQAAEAKFRRLPDEKADERTAWARRDVLKGPRPPLERVPKYPLRLPVMTTASAPGSAPAQLNSATPNAATSSQTPAKPADAAALKVGEALTFLELGSHPWWGLRVEMVLEAKDASGQTGRSETVEMVLPSRRFTKLLARAVVEQRRRLVVDPRWRPEVIKALNALMLKPEGHLDAQAYLNLRSANARLQADRSRAALKSTIDQLWHVALRIEDGNLSDAERRLKDAQDKLAKALEDGASEAELEQLMKELRQAMNDYVEQLAKQAEEAPDGQDAEDREQQQLGQNDLERMMRQMEQAAKSGARDQAQQMLSEMRDMMDRLQARRATREEREAQREGQKNMEELGNMIGQQQQLMDDTFGEMKQQGDKGRDGQQNKQRGQAGKQGKQGERGQGQSQQGDRGRGEKGKSGQGKSGQQQGAGENGEAAESGQAGSQQGEGGLRDRQKQLAERMEKLKRELQKRGSSGNKEMDAAAEAMDDAERSLEQGSLDDATQHQADALDKMREGAEQMQQEMAKNGRSRYGENGETPRDPLGRPQRAQGPDAGTSVKVPKEFEMQRAREILEELRRRSGEATRPPVELDYLGRLLKRF
ncbi:MAG: DUF4175 domain-containing protein [Hyphomicrobium aestuarii]|nr:DUF4175 domain-containing protein [Hyphomicrobium aestuarii]